MTYRNPGNFPASEMTFSQTAIRRGISNDPDDWQWDVLEAMAHEVLQPARDALGPIRVTSGYRCPALNRLVHGSSKSDHMILRRPKPPLVRSCAADLAPAGPFSLRDLFLWLHEHTPWARLIWEFGSWVHVSFDMNGPPAGRERFLLEARHRTDRGKTTTEYTILDLDGLTRIGSGDKEKAA